MFPDIDEVHEILNNISDRIPEKIYQGLNGGIILSEDLKYHPEMEEGRPLYILGEYINNILGRSIKIYYGSIKEVYEIEGAFPVEERLEGVLFHELTHHLESLAGEEDLEIEDFIEMENYRKNSSKD